MKKMYSEMATLLLLLAALPFNGCLKDTAFKHYTLYKPVYKTLAQVQSEIKSTNPVAVQAPGKMFIIGNTIFLSEKTKGIHIIDNSNPAAPVNKAFIPIPGNEDIAVYGNTLYADCYTALFSIDITNPLQAVLTKTDTNLFPDRNYVNGFNIDSAHFVIYGWEKKDTAIRIDMPEYGTVRGGYYYAYTSSCANCISGITNVPTTGQGGSMARFAILNNYLYAVTTRQMKVLSLVQPQQPALQNTLSMNGSIETIYPFQDKLFIGSATGMMIYSIANPQQPVQMGTFAHARVCDPVITDGRFAYVTLRSGSQCAGFTNQLDVVNVQNLAQPALVKSYPLTNPHGLSKENQWLFICDGKDGLKWFDATDANNIVLKNTIPIAETYDIICYNHLAIVSAADGLYQYDYSDINSIKQLSKIGWSK